MLRKVGTVGFLVTAIVVSLLLVTSARPSGAPNLTVAENSEQPARDEDFVTFDAVDSETDDLPVDIERKNWSAEALERKDAEIAEAEALYKNNVIAACRKLIERFAIYPKFES